MSNNQTFQKRVDDLVKLGRPTIGFGLAESDADILTSLKEGSRYANIVIVGPRNFDSGLLTERFEVVLDEQPERTLARMLAEDDVDGIIRGTIDDLKTTQAYEELTGEKYTSGLIQRF